MTLTSIDDVTINQLNRHSDGRGWLVELYRVDELDEAIHPVMAYISQTMPGVTRGPHEHHEQTDYFVFIGPGDFELFLWDARKSSPTFGIETREVYGESNPCAVSIPPGVVHAYRNISDVPGWVYNGPNKLYAGWNKTEVVDEIRHELNPESPYQMPEISSRVA